MYQNKVFFMIFVACWSCSMTMSGVAASTGPLQSHIAGGYKSIQNWNSGSDLDCSQFSDDYDILDHFSFPVIINPMDDAWENSTAHTNENGTRVIRLELRNENAVPSSIFCLQNLQALYIRKMPFPNGIVPDNLENLRQLHELGIFNSPIVSMTERLGTMSNLAALYLQNCTLTQLPNLSGSPGLWSVNLKQNELSKIDGLIALNDLDLSYNLFTDIPRMNNSNTLQYLDMNNNPVTNMLAITSHVNLQTVYLSNTTLSFIPSTIDRLQQLKHLDLSNNKLFYFPNNILNLANLQSLNIRNNSFSLAVIQGFQTRFNTSRPNMTLIS